jgi:hypothetical protein
MKIREETPVGGEVDAFFYPSDVRIRIPKLITREGFSKVAEDALATQPCLRRDSKALEGSPCAGILLEQTLEPLKAGSQTSEIPALDDFRNHWRRHSRRRQPRDDAGTRSLKQVYSRPQKHFLPLGGSGGHAELGIEFE